MSILLTPHASGSGRVPSARSTGRRHRARHPSTSSGWARPVTRTGGNRCRTPSVRCRHRRHLPTPCPVAALAVPRTMQRTASRQDDPTPIGKGVDSVSRGVIPRFWPRFRCPAPSLRRPEGRITRDGRGRRNGSPPGGAGMCFRWKKRGGGAVRRVPVAGGGPPGPRSRGWAAGGAWLR